jgi:very-short-patch-repair endonuclease
VSYFQALIQEGTSRDRAQVLADRYAARRLRERAINIARTETLGALNKGQLELWDQAKRLKLIGTRSRKEWIVTPDDRLAIVGPRTLIATINGWRPVATIDVGDLVLTHRDRFCRVTLVESKRYDGPTVRIRTGKKGFRATHLTYGHPVLVRRGSVDLWVLTEHLVHGDAVYVTGRPCVGCGTVIAHGPEHRDRDRHCHACNTVKVNATRWAQPAAHEQLSAQNRLRWSDPHARRQQSDRMREAAPSRRPDVRKKLRDAALTRFMDPAQHAKQTAHNRRTARLPSHPFNRQTPSERDAIRAMALKARAQKSRGMSCLERKMRWFLEQQHIAFEAQWPFRANGRQCFADFYLPGPRVVIECDGWAHGKPEVQARDVEKDVALAAQGVRVLRFSDRAIRADFLTVANAVQAHCCFVRVTPTIEHRVVRTTVYHLTVDGDESFVAGGVVVHNCPICEPLDGVTVPIDEPFITSIGPVHAPPVHPRCRCAMSLRAE